MRVFFPLSLLALAAFFGAGCRCDPPPVSCNTDADCPDDGVFCNGTERCVASFRGGVCTSDFARCGGGELCDEEARECVACEERPDDPMCQDAGAPTCEDRTSGASCLTSAECGAGSCQAERFFEFEPTVTPDGAPGRAQIVNLFPDGYCGDTCDARARNDTCGDCARCSGDALLGDVRIRLANIDGEFAPEDGVCRRTCTPTPGGTGCEREGFACDPETGICMEACVDDRQCQITLRDYDGDGAVELVDRGPGFGAYCDSVTGRCRTRGTPGAQVGDPCRDDDQCPADGACLFATPTEPGICTILGCRNGATTCPSGTVCDVRNVENGRRSACLPACEVGAEDGTPQMVGPGGGHPSCGAGRACVWSGQDGNAGSCMPGEYNAVMSPNVGGPCLQDDQCYSPFGYGECFFKEEAFGLPAGMCTVRHCAVFLDGGEEVDGLQPGVAVSMPICDIARSEECVAFGVASTETYCLQRCEDAAECQGGYACTEVISSRTYCWPYCFVDADCRAGTRCMADIGGECSGTTSERCRCM